MPVHSTAHPERCKPPCRDPAKATQIDRSAFRTARPRLSASQAAGRVLAQPAQVLGRNRSRQRVANAVLAASPCRRHTAAGTGSCSERKCDKCTLILPVHAKHRVHQPSPWRAPAGPETRGGRGSAAITARPARRSGWRYPHRRGPVFCRSCTAPAGGRSDHACSTRNAAPWKRPPLRITYVTQDPPTNAREAPHAR